MKPVNNILSKLKKANDVLQPQVLETPAIKNNETVLIYDLLSVDNNLAKIIVLPITGTSYTISYNNKKDTETSTDDSNFPTIELNGGKKYTVKINGLVEHFGGESNDGGPLDGVEYLVEVVKLGPLNLSQAFFGASKLIKVPTKLPSGVTDMSSMFFGATSFNQSLNSWVVSSVTDMSGMFNGATSFNQPLNSWDISSVELMKEIFYGATSFNQPLNNWDVSKVENMSGIFNGATSFNQPLNNWDVSKVENMSGMFNGATSFNQPLNNWDVSEVTDMSNMFKGATSFNQPLNMWVVSSVIDMTGMFQNATSFNQPLNNWNVGEVTLMGNSAVVNTKTVNYGMFAGAISFNQPLNNWNVGKVTNMTGMFQNATSFNQPLHNWNLKDEVNCTNMLDYCGMSQYNYQITLIGWYNTCVAPADDIAPSAIGAAGMIYNKNINYGVQDNTATATSPATNIETNSSWKLQADGDPVGYINFIRRAREHFGVIIEGDIEVNF